MIQRIALVLLASWIAGCWAIGAPGVLLSEYTRASNESLLWGPYRSNLYFGVRPRIPESLISGIMWYASDDINGLQNIRHSCETGDDLASHAWIEYDPRVGGKQIIKDRQNDIALETEFYKSDDGSWIARIKGTPLRGTKKDPITTIVLYTGLEGPGYVKLAKPKLTRKGLEGDIEFDGLSPDLGKFKLLVTDGPETNKHPISEHPLEERRPSSNSHYASLDFPGNAWRAQDVFLTFVQDSFNEIAEEYGMETVVPPSNVYFLQNREDMKGNIHFVQKAFQGSFEFDVVFMPKDAANSTNIEQLRERAEQTFGAKFNEAFTFQAPYNKPKYEKFAKEMLSSLLGGIGYFHGTSLVDRSDSDAYTEDEEGFWIDAAKQLEQGAAHGVEEGPFDLFTAVPSRPFFPRGFYWDEGFHLLPILEYDADLAMEIVKSWMALVDEDGWIAREQILGLEARSKVPEKFQTQFPHYANPPTLMMLFSRIATRALEAQSQRTDGEHQQVLDGGVRLGRAHLENPDLLIAYAKEIYPELKLHYEWFRRTQRGEIDDWERSAFSVREGYRWRGRTPTHCLTSGLDDYPRAPTPHTGELHIDLLSWMGMMTRAMKSIAHVIGSEDEDRYAEIENAIVQNIDDLHWSEDDGAYCDLTVDDYGESVFSCHKGYVTLFPLLLQLLPPNSDNIMPLLELMKNPDAMWSDYGLRSLAKNDPAFGTGENYWRGPVWINMNYLAIDALKYYGLHPDTRPEVRATAAVLYETLRKNIVDNVYRQWKKTGFAWEQYDALTGDPRGVRNFLGWTSLVVNIMAMPETLESV